MPIMASQFAAYQANLIFSSQVDALDPLSYCSPKRGLDLDTHLGAQAAGSAAGEEERVAIVVRTARALLEADQAAEASDLAERSLQTCSRRHRYFMSELDH